MICYLDMTFCSEPCGNESCNRRLTPKIEADAERWWKKPNPPIALANFRDGCGKYMPPKDTNNAD